VAEKRSIKAREIIRDVRSGLTDTELMNKYRLSTGRLKYVLDRLVEAKALETSELQSRISLAQESTATRAVRARTRSYLLFSIPVYDTENLQVEGWLVDIEEKGLQISGIQADVGEVKSLLIRSDEFVDVYPFGIDAECRWVEPDETEGSVRAGFEIVSITKWAMEELQKLKRLVTFSD
jgi:hypothetical protein